MHVRGNIFIKMFIGFWLATITILGSWMLASNYFEERPPVNFDTRSTAHPDGEARPPGPPHRFVLRIIYNLQNLEDHELAAAVESARQKHDLDIFLLNPAGEDLLGRQVPKDVLRTANQLQHGRRRAFLHTPKGRLVAHEIYRKEQGPLRAVLVLNPHRAPLLNALGGSPWLRVGLAALISGLVCFGLSRLMTNRLKELQMASRRLANGELDTRLQVRERGGDETDELARDFNCMAGQLQERIQAQKRLLGDVSHELRSPLARLRIALALAEKNGENNEQYLRRIEQEAERLEDLIGQLLSSQERDITLDSHIDLVPLLEQLCADANFEGHGQGKQVLFYPDIAQAIVDSSGDLLQKIFDNILRNALTHTPPNSQVTVTLTNSTQEYHIAIEDRGPGVPQEDLGNIFGEFFRVDSARTRESGGYGLGLAIARRSVLLHGGRIRASNTASGLKIIVSLPVHSA